MKSDWMVRAPLVIGHRGAPRSAPENTLAGFRVAAELGADGIELDAKLTADGIVVCHHDRTLERTTDGQGRVLEWPWEDLRRLDAGAHFGPAFAGEPIPRLEDVFAELGRRLLINVELTNYASPRDALPEAVLALVRKFHLEQRVLLSSFNTFALRRSAHLTRRMPLALLLRQDQGPIRRWLFPRLTAHEAVNLGDSLASRSRVMRILGRGLRLMVWTVNEGTRARELVSWGVHGLITDRPDVIRKALGS